MATEDNEIIVEGKNEHKFTRLTSDSSGSYKLTGMYKEWFLDYASYTILERAVPHLEDGLKPVQRRILHSMKKMDDGRYNKVANIIGHTMQYHPHGDASIGDALVQIGQKDLMVECQGNWGNILTGDGAAAPRYIEARLSKFAIDVAFNAKTTEWMASYDGRNQEPITLPVKFPLLLAQGVEGIAVGLASKILPHNFNELIDAAIGYLRGEEFTIYPDFPTGGMIDVSRYNDGLRGGAVKVRAKIARIDKKTLAITEVPFGRTTTSIIDSILKANDKGKIKIKKVDDNTAANVEIQVHLTNDVSPDKTIDALYAFTDCEISISPNSCVIYEKRPLFIGVSEMLKRSVDSTKQLLYKELEIRMNELEQDWHMSSLEKIFIEERIYHDIEQCETWESVIQTIDKGLEPFKPKLRREVTEEDIVRLTEIKIKRISKYDTFRADEHILSVEKEMESVQHDMDHIVPYTIKWYETLKKKYGTGRERRTEIRSFDTIEAAKVVVANAKLYVDRSEGFFGIGNGMKKDEFVSDCSDIDDVIVFTKDGKYIINKVCDKAFFNKNITYIGIFKRGDERTIYNIIYRDGKNGAIMMKRCAIKGITRDKEYDITKGTPGSEILYMSVNPNGEAEVLKIYFKPRPRLKKLIFDMDFSTLAIKGRQSQGNLLTRYAIHKIVLKSQGISTLGGQNISFDEDVRRLNNDSRGRLLGNFAGDDKIIVFSRSGFYYTTGFDLTQHFPEDMLIIKKFDPDTVYSVVYLDTEQGLHYVKRFTVEESSRQQFYLEEKDHFVAISEDDFPRLCVKFGKEHADRTPEEIDVEEFIGVKSAKAKGKRVSTLHVGDINFGEPFEKAIPQDEESEEDIDGQDVDEIFEDDDPESSGKQMELF